MKEKTLTPAPTQRPVSYLAGLAALLLLAVLLKPGASVGPSPNWGPLDRGPEIATSSVDRDLAQIQLDGTLRVLMRPGSSSYLVLRGEEVGFEYELAHELARGLDLKLQIVLPDSQSHPLESLNRGDVDLVAIPLLLQESPPVRGSATVLSSTIALIGRSDRPALDDTTSLQGVPVAARRGSAAAERLRELGVFPQLVDAATPSEELLAGLARGDYPYAALVGHEAQALLHLDDQLRVVRQLGEKTPMRWAMRSNSPDFAEAVDHFMSRQYRGNGRGAELYNVLWRRYFRDVHQIRKRGTDPFRLARTGQLSPFDGLFRAEAKRHGIDWLLVASLSFQESRFDPAAQSWAAVGLMQLRPKSFGATVDSLLDPETNVRLGVAEMARLLKHFHYLPSGERLRFSLAAYNAGVGHLDDARILALTRGRDPNRWVGNVRESLMLLRRPEHHRKSRYGYVRADETVGYVDGVLRRYSAFRRLLGSHGSVDMASTYLSSAPTGQGAE